ncbi:arsinothricin resistance N-acetyltransferase ArsN1 family B [Haloferula sp. BvORR071]|uniref:arsinothricin resistance N-acetyltransferase ArsN1 family B n=1 Tax=Haloferula sp. BvORR071 TaxID=1396141 RepID=UPI00055233EE|nr:arsinothricin resistance N-acetyltransferase ArsN1 family B [Haloferula sp. BvORR071]
MPLIREATLADAAPIQAIYAAIVRDTVISFEIDPPTVGQMEDRMQAIQQRFPWLVCEIDDEVAGYVYASAHHERAAYQWSVNVSVYIHPDYHRRGIGRALYTSLFALLRLQGIYNAYAGITLPNPGSVGIHESMGFEPVGIYKQVGYKFGAWHDVGWWSLALRPLDPEPAAPFLAPSLRDSAEWQAAMASCTPLARQC